MELFPLILLAIVQGITEFLPISSSGHLILIPKFLGFGDQGLALDVAVHVGTLGAVILYFRSDVLRAIRGLPGFLSWKFDSPDSLLTLCLFIATIPVVLVGLVLKIFDLTQYLRDITLIGWTMLLFGLLLWWMDQRSPNARRSEDWNGKDALIMGLWQVLALLPGTSRSGITMTGARHLGFDRESAARLSMLMSIPTILASGVLLGADVVSDTNPTLLKQAALAAAFAFVAALLALVIMMRLLKSVSFTPYVIYRALLGMFLLALGYGLI